MKNRTRRLRAKKELSLADVAAAVGTSRSQIQKLESGQRRLTIEWMQRIAVALGVELADLLPRGRRSTGPAERELLVIFARLPRSKQKQVLAVGRRLLKLSQPSPTKVSRRAI